MVVNFFRNCSISFHFNAGRCLYNNCNILEYSEKQQQYKEINILVDKNIMNHLQEVEKILQNRQNSKTFSG